MRRRRILHGLWRDGLHSRTDLHHPKEWFVFPDYGRVLHDQCIQGTYVDANGKEYTMKPEGKLQVKWHKQEYAFPDGENMNWPIRNTASKNGIPTA